MNNDFLNEITDTEKQAARKANRALIIQPGAIGDCILTLPLAQKLKKSFNIGTVQMLGKSQYIDYFPNRSVIDGIRDMDSLDIYKLFVSHDDFEPEDEDLLIEAFKDYQIIITFLGEPGSDFELNLTYAANCSNPVEVLTFPLRPGSDYKNHLIDFHSELLVRNSQINCDFNNHKLTYLKPMESDKKKGKNLLAFLRVDNSKPLVIIQPGSGGREKCWHIDNFYALADGLCDKGFSPLFLLGPAESEKFKKSTIDRLSALAPVVSDLTLTEVFQLISVADCFVGNDSGITHMAATTGIPTISCFGPTNTNLYHPLGPKTEVVQFAAEQFTSPDHQAIQIVSNKVEKFLTS